MREFTKKEQERIRLLYNNFYENEFLHYMIKRKYGCVPVEYRVYISANRRRGINDVTNIR